PEGAEGLERAPEADLSGADHRRPAVPQYRPPQCGAEHEVGAAKVHDGPVAPVVQVQRGVEVVRPDPERTTRQVARRVEARTQERGDDQVEEAQPEVHESPWPVSRW